MAMAMATVVLPRVPFVQNMTRSPTTAAAAAAATSPLRLHLRRRGGGCRSEISNSFNTAQATGRRSWTKFAARADGAAPGDLLTEDLSAEDETCEIVQGSNVTLGEGQDTVQAYLIQAIKNNNGVAVLCLPDEYGFENEDNRSFAYRLACFGYNVLVPDLFKGEPWSEERSKNGYEEWQELNSPDQVAGSIDVATKYLAEEIDAVGKLLVIGFGFGGGRLIETLARDSKQLFATGAFLYGSGFESTLAAQIKVPLLLIASDGDPLCSPEKIRQIEKKVQGSKAKIYPGLGHAFAHRPNNSEEDEASEEAFTEIRHWCHDRVLSVSADGINPKTQ